MSFLTTLATLNIGYYSEVTESEARSILFLKKPLTPRMKFQNIYVNDGFYRKINELSNELRQCIVECCKYRFGIDTQVKTQAEIEAYAKM